MEWTTEGRLHQVLYVVEYEVAQLQSFFDVISDLDSNTLVLEPSQPTYGVSSRRIAVTKTCSILVDIDLENPFKLSGIQFLGPPDLVKV